MEYVQRCKAETVAMRAEPLKQYMMQQLMPVLSKALVDATIEQPAQPVQFVADELLEVSVTYRSTDFLVSIICFLSDKQNCLEPWMKHN